MSHVFVRNVFRIKQNARSLRNKRTRHKPAFKWRSVYVFSETGVRERRDDSEEKSREVNKNGELMFLRFNEAVGVSVPVERSKETTMHSYLGKTYCGILRKTDDDDDDPPTVVEWKSNKARSSERAGQKVEDVGRDDL